MPTRGTEDADRPYRPRIDPELVPPLNYLADQLTSPDGCAVSTGEVVNEVLRGELKRRKLLKGKE